MLTRIEGIAGPSKATVTATVIAFNAKIDRTGLGGRPAA